MSQEIVIIETDLVKRIEELESQVLKLRVNLNHAAAWADRWAKEQGFFERKVNTLEQQMLSTDEVEAFRKFIKEFEEFLIK